MYDCGKKVLKLNNDKEVVEACFIVKSKNPQWEFNAVLLCQIDAVSDKNGFTLEDH